jgi:polyphosphate kinase
MDSPHKMHEGQPEPSPDGSVVTPAPLPMSSDPHLFINRELSWLEFNRRVLEEAEDPANPLLERVRFLSIFGTNLDEFFMIRVSGLRGQKLTGVVDTPPDGMTPDQQLAAIRAALLPMLERTTQCWRDTLLPALDAAGIHVLGYDDLKKKQRKLLRRHFKHEIFPVLTPLAFDPGHPFPHISNLSINLAVVLDDPVRGEIFARLKVPQTLPRLLRIPGEESAEDFEGLHLDEVTEANFVWLEEVIRANLDLLFPGLPVREAFFFRVTRDADLEIEEDEASDLLIAMAEVVEQRRFGSAVRLQVDRAMPQEVRHILLEKLDLKPYQVYVHESLMGLADLNAITRLDRPSLKFPSFQPATHPQLGPDEDLFGAIRKAPIALYHPYDSFSPVVSFINQAAQDPDVIAIKQTLYRVDQKSPIVAALMEARENGKQVAALVELKARFDEENNIVWARALEEVGVHVVYGLVGLKTHAKIDPHRAASESEQASAAMCTYRHRQLQPGDRARLWRHGLLHLQRGHRQRRLGSVQRAHRVLAAADLPKAPRCPRRHARGAPPADRPRDRAAPQPRGRTHRAQDERAGGRGLHPRPLPSFPGGGASGPAATQHLLPTTRARGGERHHQGHVRRGTVP